VRGLERKFPAHEVEAKVESGVGNPLPRTLGAPKIVRKSSSWLTIFGARVSLSKHRHLLVLIHALCCQDLSEGRCWTLGYNYHQHFSCHGQRSFPQSVTRPKPAMRLKSWSTARTRPPKRRAQGYLNPSSQAPKICSQHNRSLHHHRRSHQSPSRNPFATSSQSSKARAHTISQHTSTTGPISSPKATHYACPS